MKDRMCPKEFLSCFVLNHQVADSRVLDPPCGWWLRSWTFFRGRKAGPPNVKIDSSDIYGLLQYSTSPSICCSEPTIVAVVGLCLWFTVWVYFYISEHTRRSFFVEGSMGNDIMTVAFNDLKALSSECHTCRL